MNQHSALPVGRGCRTVVRLPRIHTRLRNVAYPGVDPLASVVRQPPEAGLSTSHRRRGASNLRGNRSARRLLDDLISLYRAGRSARRGASSSSVASFSESPYSPLGVISGRATTRPTYA